MFPYKRVAFADRDTGSGAKRGPWVACVAQKRDANKKHLHRKYERFFLFCLRVSDKLFVVVEALFYLGVEGAVSGFVDTQVA